MYKIPVGTEVKFKDHVFIEYAPYYDAYKNHLFIVVAIQEGNHYDLECVDDSALVVKGAVHASDLSIV